MRSLLMYAPSNNGTGDGEKSNLHAKIKNILKMTKNSLNFSIENQKKRVPKAFASELSCRKWEDTAATLRSLPPERSRARSCGWPACARTPPWSRQ